MKVLLLPLLLVSAPPTSAVQQQQRLLRKQSAKDKAEHPAPERSLMEDMTDFTPLPCNANITVSDCDAQATTLSSILAESAASNSTAVVPCGTCVVADLDNATLSAPHGLDIQGMLYFPTSAIGTLEATHIFVQGIWKIDPPASPTPGVRAEHGRVTVRLTGPDEDVYLTPHEHNAAACASSGGSCNVGKRPIAVAGGQLDIRGVEDSEICPSWVKLKSVVSELPPRPQPAPVYPANHYVGYDKRTCRNRDELGSFTDMAAMEECMAACDADANCMSFEWGRFTPRVCRLSTTCNYGKSYTDWKQKGWNLYVKDWANDPDYHNVIGDYYVWPSYGQTGEVYPPVDPVISTSWIAHDGRSCAEQGTQIELSIKSEAQDCALRCGLVEGCTSFEYENGNGYCRLYSSCSLDITGSNPDAKWFESVPDIYAFDETSMWNLNHTTHLWLFYNEPEYYSAGTVLDVGTEAASCWDPNGDLLLTNSQDVGHWSTTYTLPVLSRNSSAGTFHVDYRQDFIGDPFTLDTDPDMASEIASMSRPVVFDSMTDHDHWHPDYGTKQIHGGHLIVYHTPNVIQRIEGIQVQHFGQQGILGRYPIHFHRSGRVSGSVVRNNIVTKSLQRCVVVHASHDVLIENNVAFDTQGHCYITEDGVEEDNTFKYNLGVKNAKQTVGISTSDRAVSTFWVTNPRNHFIGNVAAGSEFAGFWFEIGALKFEPIYTFRDNVSHNNGRHGIQLYPGGYRPSPHAYFFNSKIYNNGFAGLWFKKSENVVVMNSFFANNKHGIEHNRNNGISRIENTSFYPVPPSQVGTRCNDNKTGIRFALDPMAVSLKVLNSSFHGFGIVAPGCARTGYALQLSDIQDMSSTTGGIPDLEGLTFHPPIDSFGIEPDSKWVDSTIYLEDADGVMTSSGQPGFFVHAATYSQIQGQIQGPCSPSGGGPYMNETLWCEGSFPTSPPSSAPTTSPTPAPTTAAPSSRPTSSPTPAPTTAVPTIYMPNLALASGAVAAQSTTCHGGAASRAIDGKTRYDWRGGSVQHTCTGLNPWWMILDDNGAVVASQPVVGSELVYTFEFDGVVGRSVRVYKNGSASAAYNIAEVQVLGQSTMLPTSAPTTAAPTIYTPNLALASGAVASQSTTCYSGVASRAIDGNTDGIWANGSVQHTCNELNPWWMVTLGPSLDHTIYKVIVYNRSDTCRGCRDILDNSQVQILDGNGDVVTFQLLEGSELVYTFEFDGVVGSSVRVWKETESGKLTIAEVQVLGISS